jgi:transcriptional regulator with XRE-family HTH domain
MPFLNNQAISRRLKEFRSQKKLSARKFAVCAGIDSSQYYKVEHEVNSISEGMVEKLQDAYPDFNSNYILFGKDRLSTESGNDRGQFLDENLHDPIAQLNISDAEKNILYQQQISLLYKEIQFWKQCLETQKGLNNLAEKLKKTKNAS